MKAKHSKKSNNKFKKLVLLLLIIIFVCSIGYMCYYIYNNNKNKKDNRIINQQYNAEYNECNDREEHPQGVVHHKAAYSFMIARPLKDITDQFVFEESHR